MLSRRIRWAALVIATATATACGAHVEGTARPGEIDVRTMDIGNYSTDPLELRFQFSPDFTYGLILAEQRLGGQVATGPEIDSRLRYGNGTRSFSTSTDAAHALADATAPVLDADGLLFGFASATSELNPDDKTRQPDAGAQAKVVVMQFADEAAATKAAADLEAADFKVAADINQPVSLPKYSAAHTHWRPGIATAGSFLAHGAYVLHTMAGLKDADLGQLTDLLQKIYDAQLPLLDQLKPLDREGILRLPNDPDGMLRQTLNPDGFGLPDNDTQITSTARGFLHRVADQAHWEKVMSDAGVDRFSLSGFDFDGPSMVFRARDPRSARALASTILDPAYPGAAEAPAQVPDVVCGESPPLGDGLSEKKRYRCAVTYRRFVATVDSDQITDVHQRAAAQYALLANSTW
ncbi:hypothetical protein [Nocardia sp. NBC_00511]|uniref:DUF7373 family lipoprotein n=1 Tax=Nocardia sp. NBC_00511 TaxID=2903591 RepID=UPI0030E41A94